MTDKIDPHILSLLEFEGFLKLFYQFCKEYTTQEKAYEAAERTFISNFRRRKYSNFESFRQVRNRFLKNNQ